MNTVREARRDAKEYARAQMAYGEGAGTRRKLITATVEAKAERDPAYARLFRTELSQQDMAEHAAKARRERTIKDNTEAIRKNTKAIATGNYQNAHSTLLILIVAGYFAHRSGLDQRVYKKSQEIIDDVKARFKEYRAKKSERKQHA